LRDHCTKYMRKTEGARLGGGESTGGCVLEKA
jgi:hypothetical protein